MKGIAKLITAMLLAACAIAAPALAAEDPKPETNDFILRAPAAEIDGITSRNGLTLVGTIDTPVDPEGRSVYLVRAAPSAPPELVIEDIETLEPAAAGIEEVVLASLPELDQSLMVILDSTDLEEALAAAEAVLPPSGTIDAGWVADVPDRQMENETKDLKATFELDAGTDPLQYGLQIDFADGSSAAWDSALAVDSSCGAVFYLDPVFSGSEAKFQVTNTLSVPLNLDLLDLAWPAGNGQLLSVKLGGKLVYEGSTTSPAVIDSGWLGAPTDREIDAGKTEELKLAFELEAGTNPLAYAVGLSFAEGYLAAFDLADLLCPEAVIHQAVTFHNEEVEWTVTSRSGATQTVATIDLAWPEGNGILQSLKLKGKELQREIVREFGKHPDGSTRYVWLPYIEQPAAQLLEVDDAQSTFRGEATVAIIDTGIDPDHPLLADRVVPGYDFVNDVPGGSERLDLDQSLMVILDQSLMVILDGSDLVPLDQSFMVILDEDQQQALDVSALPPAFGHGTMVAGIIHRVAPEASLMPLKAFDASGHGNLYDIVRAIYYAVDNGANVINMSFSLETFSPELMRAVNYAARRGVSCVASAGNNGEETLVFPASFGNTLGVASTDSVGELSSFSNWGSDLVTVSAPGENVVTSFPGGGWALASGTSFAAPWISGAAAVFADKLGKKHDPGRADFYLSSNALADSDPVTGDGQGRSGHGRANLRKAVDRVKSGRYATERPLGEYTISVTFAEGCVASYPPPSSGTGCAVEGSSQLRFDGKKVLWDLENQGLATASIAGVSVAWETVNGNLKKIQLDGSTVYEVQEHSPTSVLIDSGWHDDAERREILAGETLELRLEFTEDVIWTY